MVAPNYAKRRSQFAKDIGLGTAATSSKRKHKKATKKAAIRRK
jgi:predicted transcriptional regulator